MFNYLEKQPLTTNITHQHFCGDFMGISPESRDMYPSSIGILHRGIISGSCVEFPVKISGFQMDFHKPLIWM